MMDTIKKNIIKNIKEFEKYTYIPYDNITKEIDYMRIIYILCITFLIMMFLQIFIWLNINEISFQKIKKCNRKEKKEKKGKHELNNNDMDGIIARYFMLL